MSPVRTRHDADVVVLGLGGIGSAVAYWAARQGARVVGLEQFELGHARGSSHDHSRIIRLTYADPRYVRLAQAAYRSWAEVEEDGGRRLVLKTGGIDLFPAAGTEDPGPYGATLERCGVPFEWLDGAETRRRWPHLALPEDVDVLFQASSGIVAAEEATATHQRLARHHGATLIAGMGGIEALEVGDGEVAVRWGDEAVRARHLVVCVGAWTNDVLARLGQRLPLRVTQEQVVYFRARDPVVFAPERSPVWIWKDEPCFYGFPVYGEPAVKAAQDLGGQDTTTQTRGFEPDAQSLSRLRAFIESTFPRAFDGEHLIKTCLYTLPPDRDFVLDRVPGHDNVTVFVGAGHAFKFATEIGRILAELATAGVTAQDLSLFRADRPALAADGGYASPR